MQFSQKPLEPVGLHIEGVLDAPDVRFMGRAGREGDVSSPSVIPFQSASGDPVRPWEVQTVERGGTPEDIDVPSGPSDLIPPPRRNINRVPFRLAHGERQQLHLDLRAEGVEAPLSVDQSTGDVLPFRLVREPIRDGTPKRSAIQRLETPLHNEPFKVLLLTGVGRGADLCLCRNGQQAEEQDGADQTPVWMRGGGWGVSSSSEPSNHSSRKIAPRASTPQIANTATTGGISRAPYTASTPRWDRA